MKLQNEPKSRKKLEKRTTEDKYKQVKGTRVENNEKISAAMISSHKVI